MKSLNSSMPLKNNANPESLLANAESLNKNSAKSPRARKISI
jgi:hypothetical protein